MLEDLIQI